MVYIYFFIYQIKVNGKKKVIYYISFPFSLLNLIKYKLKWKINIFRDTHTHTYIKVKVKCSLYRLWKKKLEKELLKGIKYSVQTKRFLNVI